MCLATKATVGIYRVTYMRTHAVLTGVLTGYSRQYSQVIKKPMDLSTLRKRVETGQVLTGYSQGRLRHTPRTPAFS